MSIRTLVIVLMTGASISAFSQTQQISIGYGLNNTFNDRRFSEVLRVDKTYFNANVNYHHIFKNKFEARLSLNRIYFRLSENMIPEEFHYYDETYTGVNAGVLYHFFQKKKIDLSSGYSIGFRHYNLRPEGTDNGLKGQEFTYGINLLNAKYFVFEEHFAIYGEVFIWTAYNSNFLLGVLYQF